MKPKRLLLILGGLLLAAIMVYVFVNWWFGRQLQRQVYLTGIAMTASTLECPKGSIVREERWGLAGWMRYCEKDGKREGVWQGWESSALSVSGSFRNGKEHGLWTHFAKDGNAERTIEYDNGQELDVETKTP